MALYKAALLTTPCSVLREQSFGSDSISWLPGSSVKEVRTGRAEPGGWNWVDAVGLGRVGVRWAEEGLA